MDKKSLMIVDDSAMMRHFLRTKVSEGFPELHLETAQDGMECVAKVENRRHDIVLLDLVMPRMGGLDALKFIRKKSPKTRVVICSSLSQEGAEITLEALSLGAVDYITKPKVETNKQVTWEQFEEDIFRKLNALLKQDEISSKIIKAQPGPSNLPAPQRLAVLGIAASTGGPPALESLLKSLRPDFKIPILVVIHMPPIFTTRFAARLNELIPGRKVHEATHGMVIRPSEIYIAPGDYHMFVQLAGGLPVLGLNQDPQENFCRPSADVLFRSLAGVFGKRMVASVLTGMGQDGMLGAKAIREKGGIVLTQDASSSAVYGMPKAVVEAGLSHASLSLGEMAKAVMDLNMEN